MILDSKYFKYILYAVLGIAILIGLKIAYFRFEFERKYRNVDIVMSYAEINKLAAIGGVDRSELINRLIKEGGLTSVSLEEDTIETLADAGKLTFLPGSDILNMNRIGTLYSAFTGRIKGKIQDDFFYIAVDDASLYERVYDFLKAELGSNNIKEIAPNTLEARGDMKEIQEIGVGISGPIAQELDSYRLSVIPRFKNSLRINPSVINLKFANIAHINNINTVIFEGEAVLGYPRYIPYIKEKIEDAGYYFGYIEFTEQSGAPYLATLIPRSVVRVHSISETEMINIPESKAVSRYIRGVKERNIREIIIHPFYNFNNVTSGNKITIVDYNLKYFNTIYKKLASLKYPITANKGQISKNYKTPSAIELFGLSLAVMMILILLSRYFFSVNISTIVSILIGDTGFFLIALMTHQMALFVRILALMVTVVFPTYAIISQLACAEREKKDETTPWIKKSMIFLARTVGICLLGALLLIGFLSDIKYLLGINLFFGVKIAFLLPLFLVGYYYFTRPERIRSTFYILKRLLIAPVKTSALLVGVFSMIFILIYILRSGNYISFNVPTFETHLRSFMENLLFIRPRTKEFLIGYPFLVFTFVFYKTIKNKNWLWFFTMIGTVALISLLNSFCHTYTPILITLYRTLLGASLGYILGAGFVMLTLVIIQKWNRK